MKMVIPMILSGIAPTLAKFFGSKLENFAVKKLEEVLKTTNIPQKLENLTEDDISKIKELDIELAKLNLDLVGLDVKDRDSARSREKSLKDYTPMILAYVVTIGFFGILALYTYGSVPESNISVLNIMLGSLGTAWVSIINYYFGSSLGSSRKTELLSQPE